MSISPNSQPNSQADKTVQGSVVFNTTIVTKHSPRVDFVWPKDYKEHTKQMHLHWCELLDTYKFHPDRADMNSSPSINQNAEMDGLTIFEFANHYEALEFISFFKLHDFVESSGAAEGVNYIQLRNCFNSAAAHEFLQKYTTAIRNLTVIHQERMRAVAIDNGYVGYLSSDHFNVRERIQIRHIDAARYCLSQSLNSNPEPNPLLEYIPMQPTQNGAGN